MIPSRRRVICGWRAEAETLAVSPGCTYSSVPGRGAMISQNIHLQCPTSAGTVCAEAVV